MRKIKVLYFVSSLKKCGPTNQLYYILKHLDLETFSPSIVVLSPFDSSWRTDDFLALGVEVHSLTLPKWKLFFGGFFRVRAFLKEANAQIIHSSGFLPDLLMYFFSDSARWITTLRNFPKEDYPDRYGDVTGKIMALIHTGVIRSCRYAIACSKSLSEQFMSIDLKCSYIRNGVFVDEARIGGLLIPFPRTEPVFIVVGELVGRKNVDLIVKAFNLWSARNDGVLLIVGDGPEMQRLQEIAGEKVFFSGKVDNIFEYLRASNVHISCSSSEGLPNSVLEAAAVGKVNLLSDIGPHVEIHDLLPNSTVLFTLRGGIDSLLIGMQSAAALAKRGLIGDTVEGLPFSAQSTSLSYQRLYLSVLDGKL